MSGTLLFEALRSAADRGVRVRLLLDDNDTSGLDTLLASLASHPNIEVRLFNPFVIREPRWIGYVTDFFRLNRRMHNKSFTADNQATISGGRNVGDEYFGATEGVVFVDLDVMAVGPVGTEVSKQFDRYWASGSSYPVERLLPAVNPAAIAELTSSARRVERDPAAVAYMNALRNLSFVHEMDQGSLVLDWSTTRLISDDLPKVSVWPRLSDAANIAGSRFMKTLVLLLAFGHRCPPLVERFLFAYIGAVPLGWRAAGAA